MPSSLVIFAVSLATLLTAARYFTRGAERVGLALGRSPFAIGVLIVSAGTSLPELGSSVIAVLRDDGGIVVGNVLGSCVFNTLAVTGTAAFVGPLEASEDMMVLPLPLFGMGALLFYLPTLDEQISRWEGILLLAIYGLFMTEVARLA